MEQINLPSSNADGKGLCDKRIYRSMHDYMKKVLKRLFFKRKNRVYLGDQPFGGPEKSIVTFVMVCRDGFDIGTANANTTIRLGFCHGFEQIGIRYHLVSVFDLQNKLLTYVNPIVFLSIYDYINLTKRDRKSLRDIKHFVWVDPNPDILKRIYLKYNYKCEVIPNHYYKLVADSHPNFVFAPVTQSALECYSNWEKYGLPVKSIPLACDTTRYYPIEKNDKFNNVKMAFVGGYWKKKSYQFDRYLRPYENILVVYGYNKWPYRGYKGRINDEDEKLLYQNAILSPAISEPHAEITGDIVERIFKVFGSGGLAIPDAIPFYKELFNGNEILLPESESHYHEMVKEVLNDSQLNQQYRKRGYDAVMDRHTYKNRAKLILNYFGIKTDSNQINEEVKEQYS